MAGLFVNIMFTCPESKPKVSNVNVSAQPEDIFLFDLLNSAFFNSRDLNVSNDTKYILN